jgi:hypothetical protein
LSTSTKHISKRNFGSVGQFNIGKLQWESLSTNNAGTAPTARQYATTASINGSVFLFGGNTGETHVQGAAWSLGQRGGAPLPLLKAKPSIQICSLRTLPCVPVPILVVSIMSVRVKPIGLCLRVATCLPSTAIDADSFLPQGDLLQLDALMMHWTLITANGTQPPSRSYHSMAAAGNALYLFGGLGEIGKRLSVFGLLDLVEI